MRQTFLKASFNLGWASTAYLISLDGSGDTASLNTDSSKLIVPIATTFRHLVVYSPAGTHPDYTATLMVNGVATALTCALAATATTARDGTHDVPVAAGDDVYIAVLVDPPGSGAGYSLNLSVESEGAAQWYGVSARVSSQPAGNYAGGGAFGNGALQAFGYAPTAWSNTYSIATGAGVVTGLALKAYSGPAGAASWVGYLSKNKVLQDGTGGTVNTACTLTGATVQASVSFTLPIAVGDHVDFAILRSGTNAPFALAHVAASLIFAPTDPAQFMVCGGNNDAMSTSAVEWKWTESQQLTVIESRAQVPIGPRAVTVTGLYVEAPVAPGTGASRVFTIRQDGVDTGATCTIAGSALTCQVTGLAIPFGDGDLLDLQVTPVGSPFVSIGLHWGLAFAPPPPIPPPPPGVILPIRRLRQAPHLWDGTSGHRLKYPGFQLLVEAGAPRDTDGPMSWVLQWSDDGGHSWSHEHRIEGSRLGEHTFRFWWRRLGQSRDRVFRVVNSDDAKIVVIDALLVPDPVEGSS